MPHPVISKDDCIACGVCVETCPCEVLEIVDEHAAVVNEDACVACHQCEEECPVGAITEIAED